VATAAELRLGKSGCGDRAAEIREVRKKCTEIAWDSIQHYAFSTVPVRAMARSTPVRPKTPAASPQVKSRASKSRSPERSDVLVSAVISTYLLTHLHHVLQRAEYGAQQEGQPSLAANYAQLRKVLCLDARSMEDASATGTDVDDQAAAA